MTEKSWSTCNYCNTQDHTTLQHETSTQSLAYAVSTQPPPAFSASREVLPFVIADYTARMQYYAAPERYGKPLCIDNFRNHLQDAYEEALDLPGYLRAAMEVWDAMMRDMQTIDTLCAMHDNSQSPHLSKNNPQQTVDAIARLARKYRKPSASSLDTPSLGTPQNADAVREF